MSAADLGFMGKHAVGKGARVGQVGQALPGGQAAQGEKGAEVRYWAARRLPYLDSVKVLLIAAIIAAHGIISYSSFGGWDYSDVREVTLSSVTEAIGYVLLGPASVFLIALLFLIAGLLTPPSLERKGTAAYVRDRLLRLGVPFAVWVVVLWPLLMYALLHGFGTASGSYWSEFLGSRQGSIDTGVLWFVGVLLIFSLVYAGWTRVRHRPAGAVGNRGRYGARLPPSEITASRLLMLAAAVAIATFLIRLVFPIDSERYVDLNLFQWPMCIALFGLGIVASRRGWLIEVPEDLRRRCRALTLVALVLMGATVFAAGALDVVEEQLYGGWHWFALGFATTEAGVGVLGSVWLLGAAQRHLNRRLRWAGPAISRSAYGAFMVQGLVLIGLAVALRPLPVPAEVKAVVVAVGGVGGSFGLAWLLITRIPLVGRVL